MNLWPSFSTRRPTATNDLLVRDVIRTNEMQVWFVGGHVVARQSFEPSD